jgi:hypothetical protein
MKPVLRTFLVLFAALGLPHPIATTRTSELRAIHARLILWAWEVPEHLDFIDPGHIAVAYLDQTVYVGKKVRTRPRLQPMQAPPGTEVVAVVRIEMPQDTETSPAAPLKDEIVAALLRSARRPGVSALQVDFDAVKSQQSFYGDVLRQTRLEMPPGMPLSITALASWCAYDRWFRGLPINEAVPMLFRMGKENALFRPMDGSGATLVREPLCAGSRGVSVDEPWPRDLVGKRLYVFNPRPWTEQSVERVALQVEQGKK